MKLITGQSQLEKTIKAVKSTKARVTAIVLDREERAALYRAPKSQEGQFVRASMSLREHLERSGYPGYRGAIDVYGLRGIAVYAAEEADEAKLSA